MCVQRLICHLACRRQRDGFLGRHCCDETAAEEDGNEGLHGPAKV